MIYEESKILGDLLTKNKDKIAFISKDKTYELQQVLHIVNDDAMIIKLKEVSTP